MGVISAYYLVLISSEQIKLIVKIFELSLFILVSKVFLTESYLKRISVSF